MSLIFNIEGRTYEGTCGESLLEAVRRYGYEVPSLCHHEAVQAYGACRLCLVEVVDKQGRKQITTSCNFPVQAGIDVLLNSETVLKHRRMIMELHLAMAPNSPELKALAASMGVTKSRFSQEEGDCILCGLCERVCREVVGQSALVLQGRGTKKMVGTPNDEANNKCIACGACAFVCPVKCINIIDKDGMRTIDRWKRTLDLARCEKSGRRFTPTYLLTSAKERLPDMSSDLIKKAPPYR